MMNRNVIGTKVPNVECICWFMDGSGPQRVGKVQEVIPRTTTGIIRKERDDWRMQAGGTMQVEAMGRSGSVVNHICNTRFN